ncbi:hypothetical protein JHK85_009238 [Glycine max]|nr:hypothetical protein JHK85_009238 [Glycine max]
MAVSQSREGEDRRKGESKSEVPQRERQSDIDGKRDVNRLMPENFEQNGLRRNREEVHESRSGSDNMDGGSGDDFDAADNPPRKKCYHRHTHKLIQELEL